MNLPCESEEKNPTEEGLEKNFAELRPIGPAGIVESAHASCCLAVLYVLLSALCREGRTSKVRQLIYDVLS